MRTALVAVLLATVSTAAHAVPIPFNVFALANSSTGGVGVAVGPVVAGQAFTVTASTNDLASAGALPRFADADGLILNRFATAADDSGQPVGTLIGIPFGLNTQGSFSAPFGSIVGEIGGVFQLLGTSFNGVAANTGILNLFFFDSNNFDNSGFITAFVDLDPAVVPAPAALALFGLGALGLGLARRR